VSEEAPASPPSDEKTAAAAPANRLHQMTVSYSAQEDRLLLRFGTTAHIEYRLWLTRRMLRLMWEILVGAVETSPDIAVQPEKRVRQAVMSMRHQEAVQDGDFSQKRDPEAKPLPQNERPFLVTAVKTNPAAKGHTQIVFKVEAGTDVQIVLNEKLIHALCHMLISGAEKAEWRLGLTLADATVLATPKGNRLN
jgi:hypothetical protein